MSFLERAIAPWLSHKSSKGAAGFFETLKISLTRLRSQMASDAAVERETYSASVVDLVTIDCHFADHEMAPPMRNV